MFYSNKDRHPADFAPGVFASGGGYLANQEIILQCEEDNLDPIDEELIRQAEKFGVPPRKLLILILDKNVQFLSRRHRLMALPNM